MKKTLHSPRLGKDFELEVCAPCAGQIVGDGSDITIVRAIALENILYNDLAGAVSFEWREIGNGAIAVDLRDDLGVHVVGIGDNTPKGLRGDIAKQFPEATAWSRAISAAVIKYLGFEGRVYTDASFEIAKESEICETVSDIKDSGKDIDPLSAATTTVEDKQENFANYIWPNGKAKGMTVREILKSDDRSKFFFADKKNEHTRGYMYLKYISEQEKTDAKLKKAILEILQKIDNGEVI